MSKPEPAAAPLSANWENLPVGAWFLLESPDCVEKYSVQERTYSGYRIVCSTPYWHPRAKAYMEEIAASHNAEARPAVSPQGPSDNQLGQALVALSCYESTVRQIHDMCKEWADAPSLSRKGSLWIIRETQRLCKIEIDRPLDRAALAAPSVPQEEK